MQMSPPLCIDRQSSVGRGRDTRRREKSHNQGLFPIDNRKHEWKRRLLVKEQAALRVLSVPLTNKIYTEICQRNLAETGGNVEGPLFTSPTFK